MSAATLAAGAKCTAEAAELRKAEGKKAQRSHGRTTERLRKLSHSQVSELCPTLAPTPALVQPRVAKVPRKSPHADPPPGRGAGLQAHEQAVIDAALAILASRMREPGCVFTAPQAARDYLTLHLAGRLREAFAVLYLDSQHRLLTFEVPFEGTLAQTAVYPREIVRRALELNAAAVILSHNHPSGVSEPSRADETLTQALRNALQLIDVCVLDHIVVGSSGTFSFADRGLL